MDTTMLCIITVTAISLIAFGLGVVGRDREPERAVLRARRRGR